MAPAEGGQRGIVHRQDAPCSLIASGPTTRPKQRRRAVVCETPFHKARAIRLTRIMAAASTKKASAEDGVAS